MTHKPEPKPAKKPGPNLTLERAMRKEQDKYARFYERTPDGKPKWVSWDR